MFSAFLDICDLLDDTQGLADQRGRRALPGERLRAMRGGTMHLWVGMVRPLHPSCLLESRELIMRVCTIETPNQQIEKDTQELLFLLESAGMKFGSLVFEAWP